LTEEREVKNSMEEALEFTEGIPKREARSMNGDPYKQMSEAPVFPVISNKESGGRGISPVEEVLRGFLLAVGNYYRVPQAEVVIIRRRGIPADQIPVVLFIAKRAHVEPKTIVDLRLQGSTWLGIALRHGLGPDLFYVPTDGVVTEPPFAKAYGYYKNKFKKDWNTIPLGDDDIINLVNLKWVSEHYGYAPGKIIRMRSGNGEFISINEEIRRGKERFKEEGEQKWAPRNDGFAQ
jgi:hypothetical protein